MHSDRENEKKIQMKIKNHITFNFNLNLETSVVWCLKKKKKSCLFLKG